MVTGRAAGIDVPRKMINPGLWDRLAHNAHKYDMTVDEYCNFLLEKECLPEILRRSELNQDAKVDHNTSHSIII